MGSDLPGIQQRFARAKQLIEAGKRHEAHLILVEIEKSEPTNEEVLLYLAHTTDEDGVVRSILERVVKANPANESAQQWLTDIRRRLTAPDAPQSEIPYKRRRLGRFRILEKLGQGIGVVYKAVDLSGETFALKLLPPPFDEENARLLSKEVLAASKLDHPQIVKVYGRARDDDTGCDYLVMEYVSGRDLGKELEGLSLNASVDIIKQCCEILSYCHRNGVYHRDLKPSNIMIVKDQEGKRRVKLLDFGLSVVLRGSMTRLSKVTPQGDWHYWAPELFEIKNYEELLNLPDSPLGEPRRICEAVDIYAMGVIFYQLLTKVLPFDGSQAQIIDGHRKRRAVPPDQKDPSIPHAISRRVMSALEKRPYSRPTAHQLSQALTDIESRPGWQDHLYDFLDKILWIAIEAVVGLFLTFLVVNLNLSLVLRFVVFGVLVLVLGGSFLFFLFLWLEGVRNSYQLAISGAAALVHFRVNRTMV